MLTARRRTPTHEFLPARPAQADAQLVMGSNADNRLQSLLVTWPEQLVTALGESSSTTAAESVSTALPDLFAGLVSF